MMIVIAIAGAREARRAAVDAVTVKNIAAIVEERATAPKPTERALKARMSRLAALEAAGLTILPVRFGTTVASATELRALLRPQAAVLEKALADLRGRRQMTVRVRGERARLSRRTGVAYLASLARAAKLPEADPLRKAVASLVVDERVESGARAGFAGTVHHLIEARDAAAYRAAAAAIQRARPRAFVVTGPSMPFAFVPGGHERG